MKVKTVSLYYTESRSSTRILTVRDKQYKQGNMHRWHTEFLCWPAKHKFALRGWGDTVGEERRRRQGGGRVGNLRLHAGKELLICSITSARSELLLWESNSSSEHTHAQRLIFSHYRHTSAGTNKYSICKRSVLVWVFCLSTYSKYS